MRVLVTPTGRTSARRQKEKGVEKSPKGEKRLECPFLQPATPQVLIHQITKYMFVLMFLGLLEVVKLGQGVIST